MTIPPLGGTNKSEKSKPETRRSISFLIWKHDY
jgi:hypothetical protein